MNDDQKDDVSQEENVTAEDGKPDVEQEALTTFDMYHFFSRKDVVLMIVFIVAMLAYITYRVFTLDQVV